MRWSGFWWFALLAAAVLLEESCVRAAPNPQPEDMWKTLLELDRMYSSIARPRFGKRTGNTHTNLGVSDYENQYQSAEPSDYFPVRR